VDPGVVTDVQPERLLIGTSSGQISLEEVQLEGRRRMTITEFLRGHHLQPGDRFGE
jgi:methionyl-tRNA formyltransferase